MALVGPVCMVVGTFLGYDNTDVEAIALNDEGYLLADTVTLDGYYVNKRGVLEIDGREVTHCEECIYIASSIDVPDKNHVDLSKYNDWEIGIGHCWSMTAYPFENSYITMLLEWIENRVASAPTL